MTLTEVVVTVGLLALISTVIVGAVSVVFRSERGVTTAVAESHDVQQAVNYFYLDVQSGPFDPSSYRSSTDSDRGSGCDDVGSDNVFRFDDDDRRVAYRLIPSGDLAALDRYECDFDGTAWSVRSRVNIADSLDTTSGNPVSVTVASTASGDEVEQVEMAFAQSAGDQVVAAAPRAETGVSAASLGDCDNNPLKATEGFETFVEGDVHIVGSQVKRSLAVGGNLSFSGNVAVGQNMNHTADYPVTVGYTNASLIVGNVAWAATPDQSKITLHSGTDGVFGTFVDSSKTKSGQNWTVFPKNRTDNKRPEIKLQNGGQPYENVSPIAFSDAFDDLRACSDLMAALPDQCACAEMVSLTNVNGNTYEGTASNNSVKLVLQAGKVNAFNVPEANLDQLRDIKWSSAAPSTTTPLIINVIGGPDVTFEPPQIQGGGSTAQSIIWNFPHATGTVTIAGGGGDGVWGTVFAPYAHVTATTKIEGGVVAKKFTFSGSSINPSRSFEGTINWDVP
ncbi:MAG: choice-of-anchor A family protein [Ilumatobacter fluminis]